jgi:hypothetical protein
MRLITTETPGFSWAGSAFILGLAAAFGLSVGVAAQERREGRSRWWLLAAVPGLLLFAGPGMLFMPAFVIGGIALRVAVGAEGGLVGPWSPRRVVGLLAAALAVCAVPVIAWRADRLNEVTMLSAPTHVQLAELLGMPVLCLWLAWHGRSLWWGVKPAPSASASASASDSM